MSEFGNWIVSMTLTALMIDSVYDLFFNLKEYWLGIIATIALILWLMILVG